MPVSPPQTSIVFSTSFGKSFVPLKTGLFLTVYEMGPFHALRLPSFFLVPSCPPTWGRRHPGSSLNLLGGSFLRVLSLCWRVDWCSPDDDELSSGTKRFFVFPLFSRTFARGAPLTGRFFSLLSGGAAKKAFFVDLIDDPKPHRRFTPRRSLSAFSPPLHPFF